MSEDPRHLWIETALLGGDLRLLQLLDAMPHMAWVSSVEGGCEFVNRRWVEYTGIAASELLGDAWRALIHPDDRERTHQGWLQGSSSLQAFQVSCRIRGRDGYRWFDTRGVPLRNADGRVVKWFGTNTDIHDAHEARQALAKNEERLRYVSLASNDCVYDWDIRRGETYRNEAFQKFFGAPPTIRSSERWWEQRIHPDDRQRVMDSSTAAFAARQLTWRTDYRLRRPDGTYAAVTDRAYLLYDENKKPIRMIGAIAELTERKQIEQSLRDAQARLASAMDAAGLASWIWEIAKDELYWDDAAFRLWGRQVGEFDKLSFSDIVALMHPDDRERIRAQGADFFRTGVESPVEFRTLRPDGALQWLVTKGVVERNADGVPLRMVGVYLDITERKQVEQSLRDAQARLTTAMQAAGLAIWSWDAATDAVIWDEDTQRLWGRASGEPLSMSTAQFVEKVDPADRARIVVAIEEFLLKGPDTPVEFRTLRPDGKLQWLSTKGHAEFDDNGKPVRAVGVYLDITERKLTEQSMRDIQERLESAMSAGELATWIWDLTKDELYWDEAAFRMWGLEADSKPMSSSRIIELMHPDDRARVLTRRTEFVEKLDDTDVEFRVARPDGSVKWLLAKGRYSADERGNPVRMVGVYQDITERKRAETARLSSQKMEALGTLAGGIAHDFNNLLLVIAGNTRLALEDLGKGIVDRDAIEQTLREVDKASLRASELVKRILMFSRHQEAKREAVSLRPLVEEALRLLRPTLPASIEIRASFDRQTPAATVDAIQVHQVIMNLVTNAAHAIGNRHGAIDIQLCAVHIDATTAQSLDNIAAGEYACLSVLDNGCGIEPALIGRIFDPFFTTKKPGEGTGLGLAVVHGIVKSQGGAITVRSDLGHGSEFVVYLPAAGTDVAATATLAALPLPGAGQHVLYVDDEEPLVYLIVRVLERLGYRVTGCIDPEQALAELRADPQSFDVLVTDLAMRGMNGFELTRAAHAVRADLPVLLTSGYLRTEDRETAQQIGIRELILKPNTVEELGQAIDRALAQSRRR